VTKQSFIKGAMILLIAGIINRILGFVPRIAMPRIIGAEGVGLYQLSYPFLIVLLTIITGGIPLAIAKWVAEAESKGDARRVRQIFRAAMSFTILLALVLTALFIWLTPWMTSTLMTDTRVYQTFLTMSPMLLIVGISSVYRGYFQGKQNMVPTAISQTAETSVRIVFQLLFPIWLLPYGLAWAAAGAMIGVVTGEIAGLLVMLWFARRDKRKALPATEVTTEREPVLRRLLGLSVPVTGSKLIGSFSYLLESIVTARALAVAGIATAAATAQYGSLQGMIIPVLLLPTALTYSLAVSLVPSLSEAAAQGNQQLIHKRLHQSMRLALVTGAPFIVIMALFAEPICRILYHHADIAPMLMWMAPIGLFIYMQAPLQAALQALNKPGTALFNTFIGAIVKLVLIMKLASMPELGIYGALIAINVNIMLVTILHWFSVYRLVGFRMQLLDFVKVGAAMIIMGAAALWVMNQQITPALWANFLTASIIGAAIYLLLMIKLGIINRHDVARVPLLNRWFK